MKTATRILILALVLWLAASAATKYTITVSAPTAVGSIKLDPGKYTVEMRGAIAVFAHLYNGTSYTTQARTEAVEKKFDSTTTETSKDGDLSRIKVINLGGAATRVLFD